MQVTKEKLWLLAKWLNHEKFTDELIDELWLKYLERKGIPHDERGRILAQEPDKQ